MADNVTLNAGAGGDTIAADDVGGVKYQRVKQAFGADGAATDVSTSNPLPVSPRGRDEWETVAASQTDQSLGATGGSGDFLSHLVVVPATTSPGAVSIKDGAGSAITVFTGGSGSVLSLVPFTIYLGMTSLSGAWKVTTGVNVSVIGVGDFT